MGALALASERFVPRFKQRWRHHLLRTGTPDDNGRAPTEHLAPSRTRKGLWTKDVSAVNRRLELVT
jgi:hypothetical protein